MRKEKDRSEWGKGISTGVYLATHSFTCLLVYLSSKLLLSGKLFLRHKKS